MAYPHGTVPTLVKVHPTPVYETLAYLAIFALLWRWRRTPQPDGTIFCWYLVLASGARFLVEFLRVNPVVAGNLTSAQLTSIVLVAIGGARLLAQQRWRAAEA
jgi:phosphatidylglycerol:prolipoprotein diacylglycerol transferase